ncbi:sensor histidine kinase [[Limnothrix rosea] IAM M-220]|uniref:sensor histidine kinase n=1 Tax=[Limnothrix rosea] IAM M-220 TaxID=454133 RepID=UPI00096394FB|nr:HAMP domain-containing sensor histidine kinase [[Limnothrix rosea] IAM M-220]OKH19012.1 histidine kinase [[Limnothrix rosea] IAM M-220]
MTTFPQLLPVGVEFTALCQQQLQLLTMSLGADWSVLYLAQPNHNDQEIELQVVSSYPERVLKADHETVFAGTNDVATLIDQTLTAGELAGTGFAPERTEAITDSSTAFPLLHEDLILGILATGRADRGWRSPEIAQIEMITKSLSWACVIDQQKSWTTQQLTQQRHLQEVEQEHFHDLLHQLRNPTMAIGTFGKLLLKRLEMDDRNYAAAAGVVRESDRLKDMLHQFGEEVNFLDAQIQRLPSGSLLALPPDKLSSGSMAKTGTLNLAQSIPLTMIDLVQLLQPIIESMAAIAAEQNITLQTAIASDVFQVWGNAQALTEVISNLVENAIKYTPSNGVILLQLQRMGEAVQLSVHDTGYGIPAQDLDQIFERHYRGVQAESEIPGTGLGLAIAAEFVHKMDGDLEVDSPCLGLPTTDELPGSTFTLWLKAAS